MRLDKQIRNTTIVNKFMSLSIFSNPLVFVYFDLIAKTCAMVLFLTWA